MISKPALPTRALLVALMTVAVLCAVGAASASAATYTWVGGSGSFTDANNWSPSSLPGAGDDVFITAPGDYTVSYGGAAQRSVGSLTLGNASSGTQQLVLKTTNGSGDARLVVNGTTTITAHGQAILDQDSTGESAPGNVPELSFGGAASNAGSIIARNEGTVDKRIVSTGAGTITNTGTIRVQSGQFEVRHVVNTGNITVDAGGELNVTTGSQLIGVTQNAGTVVNNGTINMSNSGWAQNGGALTGNPVRILTGQLADVAGTGSFVVMGNGNKISGTVPAGQTVQFGSPVEEQSNFMNIQPGGFKVEVGGTLVLAPPPANGVELLDNPLTVDGTLQVKATNTQAIIGGGFTVDGSGTVDVQGGRLLLRGTTVNSGTIGIAPGATVQLASNATTPFTNAGTLSFQIASATSFGTITRQGNESVTLGGTANGVLVGGYVPAVGTAFKVVNATVGGRFGAVGAGFTDQYAADGLSASLVYAGAPAGGGGGGTPGGGGGGGTPGGGTTPPATTKCTVPNLRNKTVKDATAALKKAHCALGTVKRPSGRKARRAATRVVAQTKKAGTKLAENTKIGVTLGKPATKHKHKSKAKHK